MNYLFLFLFGMWTPNLCWWLVVPLVAVIMAFLFKRKSGMPVSKGAWNAVGRHWADIGWMLLLAALVIYLLSGLKPAIFGFIPIADLVNAIDKKWLMAELLDAIAHSTVYPWIASFLLLLVWGFIAGVFFIVPGNRMAREKLNYK